MTSGEMTFGRLDRKAQSRPDKDNYLKINWENILDSTLISPF